MAKATEPRTITEGTTKDAVHFFDNFTSYLPTCKLRKVYASQLGGVWAGGFCATRGKGLSEASTGTPGGGKRRILAD
jgi:hypothetical protein